MKSLDNLIDKPVGRRSSCRYSNFFGTSKISGIDFRRSFDQETLVALLLANRQQLDAVRGVASADHIKDIHLTGEGPCCILTVPGRRTNSVYDLWLSIGLGANCFRDFQKCF